MRALLLSTLLPAVLAVAAPPAAADASYAIIIGSNQGGAGQTDLQYAEDDAHRVADVLTELGGYAPGDVHIVVRPDPDKVLAAIDSVAALAAKDAAAGTTTTVFFYYSGHAKAAALDLGDHELALATLRDKLLAIPTTLTVVVLDACQSGSFSRIKGAEAAADFSFNSKSRLDATGVAVLASSTGSEVSQESDLLKSGYFTFHLLVGMRGAADESRDGRVTIDEAYRYAYNQTLLATAATAVGSQHVSLEVDLKGHGEVPLSYPQKATATVELPAGLTGEIMIERTSAHAVIAELHKAAGKPVRVAVAPAEYSVLVRHDKVLERCPIDARSGGTAVLELGRCDEIPEVETQSRGGFVDHHRLTVEATVGLGSEVGDAFTHRLEDFGYHKGLFGGSSRLGLGVRWRLRSRLSVGAVAGFAGSPEWRRDTDSGAPLRFKWTIATFIGIARFDQPLGFVSWVKPFAQVGAGLAIGHTRLVDESDRAFTENSAGPVLTGSAGLDFKLPGRVGLAVDYTFVFAPVITNLLGDRHLGIGNFLDLSLSRRF